MPLCKIHHGFLQTVQLLLALIIISSLLCWTNLAAEEINNSISIEGQVQVPRGVSISEGLDVVLIKFVLDPSGEVVPAGPVGRTKTDDKGRFRFEDPPRDDRAGYRLGTRFEGNLYSSEVFFMRPEQQLITKDIRLPSTSFDTGALVFNESSLFFES
ncbi:MAG: carboxypeptidase-like regulatory domain-containing protein, partial [SAR324 cluster bacterium]|nr:carboxypeptidase-like regulatory domain-containing protein [SAR324 cluster bacterium]